MGLCSGHAHHPGTSVGLAPVLQGLSLPRSRIIPDGFVMCPPSRVEILQVLEQPFRAGRDVHRHLFMMTRAHLSAPLAVTTVALHRRNPGPGATAARRGAFGRSHLNPFGATLGPNNCAAMVGHGLKKNTKITAAIQP